MVNLAVEHNAGKRGQGWTSIRIINIPDAVYIPPSVKPWPVLLEQKINSSVISKKKTSQVYHSLKKIGWCIKPGSAGEIAAIEHIRPIGVSNIKIREFT